MKTLGHLLRTTATALLAVALTSAAPVGQWKINANGYGGVMVLAIDTAGAVTGTVQIGTAYNTVRGFWNAASNKLTIYRLVGSACSPTKLPDGHVVVLCAAPLSPSPDDTQIFTGYFNTSVSGNHLDGDFEAFESQGGAYNRNVFGWHACQAASCN
jgi:hypothetical protein